MAKRPPAPADYDDNPVWTDSDFAAARPASELHDATVLAALVRKPAGRLADQAVQIDEDVLARWRASGAGWQTRMNELLRKSAP